MKAFNPNSPLNTSSISISYTIPPQVRQVLLQTPSPHKYVLQPQSSLPQIFHFFIQISTNKISRLPFAASTYIAFPQEIVLLEFFVNSQPSSDVIKKM
jgi:hypothetical protein